MSTRNRIKHEIAYTTVWNLGGECPRCELVRTAKVMIASLSLYGAVVAITVLATAI